MLRDNEVGRVTYNLNTREREKERGSEEMNKILGVTIFTAYRYTVTKVDKVA